MSDQKRTTTPEDELTRLANVLIQHAENDPRFAGTRLIISVSKGELGGLGVSGYPDDHDASVIAELLVQARAVLRTHGKDLAIGGLVDLERGGQLP